MRKYPEDHLNDLIKRFPELEPCRKDIFDVYTSLKVCYELGGKLLIAGNGGSNADAEHIAGELMKGFIKDRRPDEQFVRKLKEVDFELGKDIASKIQKGLPAIVLSNHQSLNTAFINDVEDGGNYVFAQQVNVYGNKGDVFFGISTSGNSKNILNAAIVAKAKGMEVIALTGESGGKLSKFADWTIKASRKQTHLVQELHLPIYHCLCLMLEAHFFD